MDWLKRKRTWLVIAIVVLIPVVAIAWWLISPVFLSKTVEEEFPISHTALVPAGMTRSQVEDVMASMAKVDSTMKEPMPAMMAEATALRTGEFRDADRFHKGEGIATIYRLSDGSHVLRVESFKVTNGPDLHVVLTSHPDPSTQDQVHQEGFLDLGKLKGNIGNQNYSIPAGADLSRLNAVVIYCSPFHVVFSVATFK